MKQGHLLIIWATLTVTATGLFLKFLAAWKYSGAPKAFYQLVRSDLNFFATLIGLLLILLLINIIFYRLINWQESTNWRFALIVFGVVSLIATASFPFASMDLFCYLSVGRIYGINHLSPYLATYSSLITDNFFPALQNIVWASKLTPYGPLAIYINSIIAWLGSSHILLSIIGFKLLALAAHALNAWLMHKLGGRKAFFLYAFNPLIIFELLINGHNEVILISFILLGLLFFSQQKKVSSWLALSLAALTKLTAIFFLPIQFLLSLKAKQKKNNLLFILIAGGGLILLAFAAYYPLIGHDWLTIPRSLTSQLEQSSSAFYSPLISLFWIMLTVLKIPAAAIWAAAVGRIVFLGVYGIILIGIIRTKKPNTLSYYLALTYGLFCFTSLTWLMPWYLTILIALLILEHTRTKQIWPLFLNYLTTLYAILYYLFLR